MLEGFVHLFKFREAPASPKPSDPDAQDMAVARVVLDFSESPYRVRLDDRLDALLSAAFDKNELEKAAGIQSVRNFLKRDLEEARRSVHERTTG